MKMYFFFWQIDLDTYSSIESVDDDLYCYDEIDDDPKLDEAYGDYLGNVFYSSDLKNRVYFAYLLFCSGLV